LKGCNEFQHQDGLFDLFECRAEFGDGFPRGNQSCYQALCVGSGYFAERIVQPKIGLSLLKHVRDTQM
jgi:hypothetical protein